MVIGVRKILGCAAAVGVLVATTLPAYAVPTIFTFSHEFSGSGGTCVNGSCASLSVEQVGTGVDFILTSNLVTGEFITGLYGNIDPFRAPAFGGGSITGGATATLTMGQDAFKADGDGYFDWLWGFSQGPNPDTRFDNSDVLKWTWNNTSINDIINAISQNGPVGKTGFTFALRVQGLRTGSGSGWFDSTNSSTPPPPTNVPEPTTLTLLGIGLLGFGLSRRRRA